VKRLAYQWYEEGTFAEEAATRANSPQLLKSSAVAAHWASHAGEDAPDCLNRLLANRAVSGAATGHDNHDHRNANQGQQYNYTK
jgi:hypothetical protein